MWPEGPEKSISSSAGSRNPVAHPTVVIYIERNLGVFGAVSFLKFRTVLWGCYFALNSNFYYLNADRCNIKYILYPRSRVKNGESGRPQVENLAR
jgi:hypothetical protein